MAIQLRSGISYDPPTMPNVYQEVEVIYEDELHGVRDVIANVTPVKKKVQFADPPVILKRHRSVESSTDRSGVGKTDAAGMEKETFDSSVSEAEQNDKGKQKNDDAQIAIQLPFPNRLKSQKVEKQFNKFLDVVKHLQVTVPFTELLQQVPSYSKFMKDVLNRKRSFSNKETIALTEQCSAILQNTSPTKQPDPGSFSIPCTIGTLIIERALCDLGASVSVIPFSVCKKLNMGELKPTNITLQMADRSVRRPLGVLEDVPVKVGNHFIPVDFVVLDIVEDQFIPIILGRPFLRTAGAVIDLRKGNLTLAIGEETVTFHLPTAMRNPMIEETAFAIDVVDESIADIWTVSLAIDTYDSLIRLDEESPFYLEQVVAMKTWKEKLIQEQSAA